ncbi:MAG: laccase domain-containing protein, partial [Anaerolineales bacterium]
MHVQTVGDIRYYQFDTFAQADVVHGVFARHGGVSAEPWASLNMSISVGDSRANVRENRERAFGALGRAPIS